MEMFNQLPALEAGVSPNEVWSQIKSSTENLQQAHMWGSPVHVLKAELQDEKKNIQVGSKKILDHASTNFLHLFPH